MEMSFFSLSLSALCMYPISFDSISSSVVCYSVDSECQRVISLSIGNTIQHTGSKLKKKNIQKKKVKKKEKEWTGNGRRARERETSKQLTVSQMHTKQTDKQAKWKLFTHFFKSFLRVNCVHHIHRHSLGHQMHADGRQHPACYSNSM